MRAPSTNVRRSRRRVAAVALLAGAAACGAASDPIPVHDGPNVVVIVLDTLRPDRLGCYGGTRGVSPFLDRVASESVLFEAAQGPAPWTAPSLITLMTSLYPDVHGVRDFPIPNRLSGSIRTLAQELSERGYRTAAFTEGGYAKGSFGLDRGFDLYPDNDGDEESYTSNLQHPSRLIANVDRTIDWLEGLDDTRPFFLFFHTYEIHSPFRPPAEDLEALRPGYDVAADEAAVRALIERWNAERVVDGNEGLAAFQRLMFARGRHMGFGDMPRVEEREALNALATERGFPLSIDEAAQDDEARAFLLDLYDAGIRFTDRELARLWDAIDAAGDLDDTIVVFTSDHGEQLGEHERVGHGLELYDELLHVLLVIHVPASSGVDAEPRRIATPVRSIDVMPTVLELAGIDVDRRTMQGASLVGQLGGRTLLNPSPALGHATQNDGGRDERASIREGRWRLLADAEGQPVELYDVEADPDELHNVVDAHPDEARRLARVLAEMRAQNAALRTALGAHATEEVTPDEALLQELGDLGYTGHE